MKKTTKRKLLHVPKPKTLTQYAEKLQPKPARRPVAEVLNIDSLPGLADKKVKVVMATDPSSMNDPELQEIVGGILKQLTEQAQSPVAQVPPAVAKKQNQIRRDLGVLESVVTEYLKSFLILGYNLDGEKIQIIHATNPQDQDSILEHARGTLMNILMRAQQNGGPPML